MARYYVERRGAGAGKGKVNAKHKIQYEDEAFNKYFHTLVFGSVRSKVLQQLLMLNNYCLEERWSWIYKELVARYKHHNGIDSEALSKPSSKEDGPGEDMPPCSLLPYLGPEDIMEILGCNRRTAAEYRDALSRIHRIYGWYFH